MPQAASKAATPHRSKTSPIRYRVAFDAPREHLISIRCSFDDPSPEGEHLVLPAWIPGSYLIRDFSRHIVSLAVRIDGRSVASRKTDLHSWTFVPPQGARSAEIDYQVYAWDLSVRGAHFDDSHAFFNGTSVFLRVVGRESAPCEVELLEPTDAEMAQWRVATTLPALRGTRPDGFGWRRANDYDSLIDHPVECGDFQSIRFRAGQPARPHRVVISGQPGGPRSDQRQAQASGDGARLARDLARLCDWHCQFWGNPPPFREYLFLLQLTADGYGGLEHRDSTALIARRDDLPARGMAEPSEGYQRLLGLCSHEYFHAWHVKRIQPVGHPRPDLQQPAPTELLWLFEGFTAYYDDLALVRSGLITPERYLASLAKTIARVLATPGRHRQSVAEAARDAWIKLYRPDENTDNATVSYYAKGSLVAMALDLRIRRESDGARSLDDLMRGLWTNHGATQVPVDEESFRKLLRTIAGRGTLRLFESAVHSTEDLPLRELLRSVAVDWQEARPDAVASLGLTLTDKQPLPKVTRVASGSAAEKAGLAGGDQLVAVNGIRAEIAAIESACERRAAGSRVVFHAFRDGVLRECVLTLPMAEAVLTALTPAKRAPVRALSLRRRWLGH